MKFVRLALITSFFSLQFIGCGFLQKKVVSRHFVVHKNWVRDTLKDEFFGYRRLHRMPTLIYENLVIQGNSIDGLVAYERLKGHKRWRLIIEGGVEAGASLVDDTLYFGAGDGHFYAVDALNGLVKWKFAIRSEGLGRPLVKDGMVYFLAGNNVAYALDAETGKQIWLYNRRDPSTLSIRGASKPAISGDKVFIGFSDGSLTALNKSDGTVVWEQILNQNRRFKDVDASPVIDGNRLYIGSYDGSLYALNINDGTTIWRRDLGAYSSVTLWKDQLFVSTSTGQVKALSKDSGKEIWSHKAEGIATQPVVHKNLVIFGEYKGSLKFLDIQSGQELQRFEPGRGVTSRPVIEDGRDRLYFISKNALLFALDIGWGRKHKVWPWQQD